MGIQTFDRYVTQAERQAMNVSQLSQAYSVYETDTGDGFRVKGNGWQQVYSDGLPITESPQYQYQPYDDSTYKYYCEADPSAALTDSVWRIARKNLSTGAITYPGGDASFSFTATDLSTVQGHFS